MVLRNGAMSMTRLCWLAALALACALASAGGGFAAAVFTASFDDGAAWRPREGMTAEVVSLADHGACLHVWGRQDGGWNYVFSDPFPLAAGRKYRLAAQLKVGSVSPPLAPYFKVECTGEVSAQFTTGRYDLRSGGWQELAVEFECPAGAEGGWVALEKGTTSALELEAWVDEVCVMEIDHFSAGEKYRFTTPPAALEKRRGVHPRLYLTAERIAALKGRLSEEPYASALERLRRVADRRVESGPPEYRRDDGHSGEEQLYQREVGNAIANLALAYVLTGERRYLESARAWMLASAGYPTWGLGQIDGMDLAAGHQLYGLALGYDWLYQDLDPQARAVVRRCLETRGGRMYDALVSGRVWWATAYLQNHQWVDMTGLAAAGLALYGEVEGVDGWVLKPLEMARETMAALGPDGASHEGVPYWTYGVEYLLKFMDLARDLLGVDLFAQNAWFEHTASFRLYSMLPRAHWTERGDLMTFADGPRSDWYGPDYMLRKLAAEYRDGHAQWLAEELDRAGLCSSAAVFLNLLWVDPSVPAVPPTDLPVFKHFDDLDIVFMRSGWEGDESVLAFKCGPYIGHHALERYSYDPGGGHVHPDAGSFLLFAHGEWLIVDDGYTWKTTAYQNTVVVNGVGQEGEGGAWFDGGRLSAEKRGPRIVRADHAADRDYVIGDVTAAYKAAAGLRRFLRHVLYLRPDCWVILDELEASSPSTFEVHFHADFPFVRQEDGSFVVRGQKGALRLTALSKDEVSARSWRQGLIGTGGGPAGEIEALTVANEGPRERMVLVTVLEAYPAGGTAALRPRLEAGEGGLVLALAGRGGERRFALTPFRADAGLPAIEEVSGSE